MPLNGGGTASKPVSTTAVAGTTIESSKFNSVIDDIYQIFNTVRPIAYGGTGGNSPAAARTALEAQKASAALTAFAGLTPTNDDVLQFKAGAWANRSLAQLRNDLGGLELIGTLTTTSGSTQALTGIPAHFKHLVIVIDGVSHNHSSDAGLNIAFSINNGSSYGSTRSLIGASGNASSAVWYGAGNIYRTGVSPAAKIGEFGYTGANNPQNGLAEPDVTGVVDAIRFGVSGGAFDAGAIHVYGVR